MTQQGTAEWLQERCGHVTASRIADVMATVKSGEAASRTNYRAELVAQRMTGAIEAGYTNAAMQHGTETEPLARAMYELQKSVMVQECGFILHPSIEWSGASPDGLVGTDGLVEIKCPNTATHIDTLIKKLPPTKYLPQMYWQMACTGRAWCDFASFDPRMPEHLQLFVYRVLRDDEKISTYEAEVVKFLKEVQATISQLETIGRNVEPTAADYINTP